MSGQDTSFRERFRFQSQALDDENVLRVMRFKGTEGLNMLYSFDIMLATQETSLPLEDMLAQPARLIILREDDQHATFSGLPTSIEQTSRFNGWTFYRLTLQPAFWKFTQIVQNSFHIDKNVQEIIDSSLDSIDYFDVSHEFRLLENYAKQEFSMQYNESIYDFMAWKMERDGIYYFFDEKDEGEHLVFADAPNAHEPLENTPDLYYSPTSGLEATHKDEVISMFSLKVSPLPRQVVLRDYDYTKPNAPVVAEAEVSPQGLGTVYYYGEGFTTEDEGGIHVLYTKESETADAKIERLVHEIGRNYSVCVVSSDGLIQLSALRLGVRRMSSRELHHETKITKAKIDEIIGRTRESLPRLGERIAIPKDGRI